MSRARSFGLRCAGILLAAVVLPMAAPAADRPPSAAIASAHPLATDAGREVLDAGGNAFDAAIAVAAALAVVEPYSSGLGGGGFFLLHRAADGKEVMIDGRETAPQAASADMYLDAGGKVEPKKSRDGALAAAIPGIPAALDHLARHYARLPLARDLAPAIKLAREGFAVTDRYRLLTGFRTALLRQSPTAAAVFLSAGEVPPVGQTIVQPDLAVTLEAIAKRGAAGFYRGSVAQHLVDGVRAVGGIWTLDDLARYRVIERRPIIGHYRGMRVVSVPPPSSGGVLLIEMLNILAHYDLTALDDITRKHLIVEAMRRAYRDRAVYLGDPAFFKVPVAWLTAMSYADRLSASIHLDRATPSASLPAPPLEPKKEAYNTTHFSIIDTEGNRVSATLSINLPYGCGVMPPGTGVILNDEMDDFSAKPDTPNAYKLIGGKANAIAPGKRPLSSMTPTFVETSDRIGILGTPGGSRIITMVLLGVLDFAAGHGPASWVRVPRFHHQYLPDVIQFETGGLTDIEQAGLRRKGHALKSVGRAYGDMQAVEWDRRKGEVMAASDPRGEGSAIVFLPHK